MAQPLPLPPPQSGDDREDQAALIAAAVTAVFAAAEAALAASIASAVRRALTTAIAGATAAIGQRLSRQAASILAVAEQRATRIVAQTGLDPVPAAVTEALESASEHAYEQAGSVYREAVDAAIAETRGGLPYSSLSLSRIQAAQKALDDLIGKGITGFTDRAGRKWDLASPRRPGARHGVTWQPPRPPQRLTGPRMASGRPRSASGAASILIGRTRVPTPLATPGRQPSACLRRPG